MKRMIVKIDQGRCNGCGLCVSACAEGAIQLVDGKARLVKDDYCDGLGACLGHCPQDAISIEEREAGAFDEAAAKAHAAPAKAHSGCPGMAMRSFKKSSVASPDSDAQSALEQWPIQLRLVPVSAPYWTDADLLVAADCTAFALGGFHGSLLKGRRLVIACPKLDDCDGYVEKLAAIMKGNSIRSVTVAHMEVPCCGGIVRIVRAALEASGKGLPFTDITVGIEGGILSTETVDA